MGEQLIVVEYRAGQQQRPADLLVRDNADGRHAVRGDDVGRGVEQGRLTDAGLALEADRDERLERSVNGGLDRLQLKLASDQRARDELRFCAVCDGGG